MKNFYCLFITILLTSNPILLLAESPWPKIIHLIESNKEIVSLESQTQFKLINLRQEENPSKLVLIFEATNLWETQEFDIKNSEISKIALMALNAHEFALEIELISKSIPEFTLSNKTEIFQISFKNKSQIEGNQDLIATPLPSKEPEEKELDPILTTEELISPTPLESHTKEKSESPQPTASIDLQLGKNILSKIDFVSPADQEQYLLLSFSDKPNFSFTLNEFNEYQITIPNFGLAGSHLAQYFYAPQNIQGILSVKSWEETLESERFLKIRIKAEEGYRLDIILTEEGIQVTASPTLS